MLTTHFGQWKKWGYRTQIDVSKPETWDLDGKSSRWITVQDFTPHFVSNGEYYA